MTDEAMKYPSNPLTAINEGCVFDTRVRMAADFIKSGVFPVEGVTASMVATAALDMADALLEDAERRGWVHALATDTSELPKSLKRHAEMQARIQYHANETLQRLARDGTPFVAGMTIPHGGFPQ